LMETVVCPLLILLLICPLLIAIPGISPDAVTCPWLFDE
jgi:hypothetical protein